MVRSKRLKDHEVTNLGLDESQTNGSDSSPILQSISLEQEPSLDPSPASDSESLESQTRIEKEAEIEGDDTVEIIGDLLSFCKLLLSIVRHCDFTFLLTYSKFLFR